MKPTDKTESEESSYRAIADCLKEDFVKQRPLYINLLDDLGSTDFFVIDGDALLFECLTSPSIDLSHGGQPLHLFYLVEDFLHSLKACLNARFCFTFFQHHEGIWQGQDESFLLLARHILQQHLKSSLHQTVYTFPSWHSKAWLDFVNKVYPEVIHGRICQSLRSCLVCFLLYMLTRYSKLLAPPS